MADHMNPARSVQFLMAMVMLAMVSCTNNSPAVPQSVDDWADVEVRRIQRIRIGVALSTSGEGSEVEARDIFQAAELAVRDAGPVRGYGLELVEFNTQCSSAGGRSAALSIVNDPTLVAIIGPGCEEACEASVPIFEAAHYTFVSPSCSGEPSLVQKSSNSAFVRTMYDEEVEAKLAADFAYNELGARNILAIGDGTSEASNVISVFRIHFVSLGGHISEAQLPGQDPTLVPALEDSIDSGFDLMYAPIRVDAARDLIDNTAAAGVADIPILGGHHFLNQWLLDSTNESGIELFAIGPTLTSPDYQAMIEDYSRSYGSTPRTIQAAYAYDAAMVVIDAIDHAASPQPNGNLLIGRSAMRTAIYATAAHRGLTGTLTCSISGDCSAPEIGVSQAINGKWKLVFAP